MMVLKGLELWTPAEGIQSEWRIQIAGGQSAVVQIARDRCTRGRSGGVQTVQQSTV